MMLKADPPLVFKSDLDTLLASEDAISSSSRSRLTSTGSTIPGIGSLSGRAIKALGVLALRGLDRVIISACISVILTKFPHSDAQASEIKGIQAIYDIVLELSRPRLYSEALRRTASALLLTQINDGHTHELEKALDRWNTVELEIFLHVLVLHSASSHTYSMVLPDNPSRSSIKLDSRQVILFMSRIARKHKQGCQAVVNVPFFRLFLSLEEGFSRSDLAEIYRTILSISKRPEFQLRASTEEAIDLLVNSILAMRPPFIKALVLWDFEDIKSLVNIVFEHLTSPGHFSTKSLEDNEATNPESIFTFLLFLHRVGRANNAANQNVFRAGYLDVLLHIEKLRFPVQRFTEEFAVVLDVLSHHSPLYTEEDRHKAADVLLVQIANDSQYLLHLLESWDPTEIEQLLSVLVKKLGTIVGSNHHGNYNDVTTPLVSFIAMSALSDHQICEVIIDAGFLNILCSGKEENEDVKDLILDILRREKYSSLVKQAAAQFISYQIASGLDDSWLYQVPEYSR